MFASVSAVLLVAGCKIAICNLSPTLIKLKGAWIVGSTTSGRSRFCCGGCTGGGLGGDSPVPPLSTSGRRAVLIVCSGCPVGPGSCCREVGGVTGWESTSLLITTGRLVANCSEILILLTILNSATLSFSCANVLICCIIISSFSIASLGSNTLS